MTPRAPEALAVALQVIELLEDHGVAYHVGGSFASSIHGVPRQTNAVDLVVDLPSAIVDDLAAKLGRAFYLDTEAMHAAIHRRSSCNLLHLASGIKIDLFVAGDEPFDRIELKRSITTPVPGTDRTILVKSAEDTVLRKLAWYRLGNEVSDRQWSDLQGIFAVQGQKLDREYLRHWASELGVEDLLERLGSED